MDFWPTTFEAAQPIKPLLSDAAECVTHQSPLQILGKLSATVLLCTFLNLPSLSSQGLNQDPLLQWMDRIAQQQLQEREDSIAQIHTVAEAERRKQLVRKRIMEILGGLPDYNGPLNARITGRMQAGSYTIEKLIFESLPGFFVTANVYRPNQPGRYPAVLFQSGHTQEGKPEPQRAAANLALKGFVVLCFDPIGQGERVQSFDRQVGKSVSMLGGSGNDHIQAGAQSMLAGQSSARYFIWDAKRALDYMQSRPDVDSTRMAAAGCSGGGALTTFIGALDPRIKAVAPACFINSYRLLFAGPDPDSEMSPTRLLAQGLDTADFVELSAPTPWLILATEGDYFSPPGAKLVYDEARRWFRLYGAEDKVSFLVGPGPHGTPLETREAIYAWMIRWLKDGRGDFHEQPVKLYSNHELLVTRSGQVEDEPGSRKIYQLILDDFRTKKRQGTIPELLAELRKLQVPSDGSSPAVTVLNESEGRQGQIQHIRLESEPGVEIDGTIYRPRSPGRKPAVLLLADELSNRWIYSTDALAEKISDLGRVVLKLNVRDSPPEKPDYRSGASQNYSNLFLGNWLADTRADLIGRNLPAMRAHDIIRGLDALSVRSDVDTASIHAAARGVNGVWLLLASAIDPRIRKVWVDRTPYSLRAALEHSMNNKLFDAVIPGFALHWDLDDLIKAMGKRRVLWTNPMNWTGQVVSLGTSFRYSYILGDNNDVRDELDKPFIDEFVSTF